MAQYYEIYCGITYLYFPLSLSGSKYQTELITKQSSETYSTTPEEEIPNDMPSSGMSKVLTNILLWSHIRS